MARGDAIGDSYISIGSGVETILQPASGDEWLVMWISAALTNLSFQGFDGSDATAYGVFPPAGGNTGIEDDMPLTILGRPLKIVLTNAQYCRLANTSGTNTLAWNGIKIKD